MDRWWLVRRSLVVGVASAMMLTACSNGDIKTVDPQGVSLGDADLALYLGPQSYDTDWNSQTKGYVLLVNPDGSYRAVKTSAMDTAKMVWTDSGLVFSDTDHDYLVDDQRMVTSRSPKTNYQYSMLAVGGSAVGVYNLGATCSAGAGTADGSVRAAYTPSGAKKAKCYTSEVVDFHDGRSVKMNREGDLRTIARCGGSVYAVAEASGRFADKYPLTKAGRPPYLLYRIWPGEQTVVGVLNQNDLAGEWSEDTPCSDGIIRQFDVSWPNGVADGVGSKRGLVASLVAWNTSTGRRTKVPLVGPTGAPVAITSSELSRIISTGSWIRGDRLYWFDRDGTLRASDVKTGVTTTILTTSSRISNVNEVRAFLGKDSLYVLDVPRSDQGKELMFSRYRISDGKRIKETEIPGLGDEDRRGIFVWGGAISPTLQQR